MVFSRRQGNFGSRMLMQRVDSDDLDRFGDVWLGDDDSCYTY